jgi:hypothetical protein
MLLVNAGSFSNLLPLERRFGGGRQLGEVWQFGDGGSGEPRKRKEYG